MRIQIVGAGCPRCRMAERNVINACAQLDLEADISTVYDYDETEKLAISETPAILIDGQVVIAGRIPTLSELKVLLKKAAAGVS